MKTNISQQQAKEKIDEFFKKDNFPIEETKKIRRLAMKFNIKLGKLRQNYCKKCLIKLKGKTNVNKTHKSTLCSFCGFRNKFRLG